MENDSSPTNLTRFITQERILVFTVILFGSVVAVSLNLNIVRSPILGVSASILFLLISSIMMGQALFRNENSVTKLLLGSLIVIITLGLVGWVVMILYNLDNTRIAVVLFVTASLASILNKGMNSGNGTE
jgi:hypothetical protein